MLSLLWMKKPSDEEVDDVDDDEDVVNCINKLVPINQQGGSASGSLDILDLIILLNETWNIDDTNITRTNIHNITKSFNKIKFDDR